jgi:hypothetical protein
MKLSQNFKKSGSTQRWIVVTLDQGQLIKTSRESAEQELHSNPRAVRVTDTQGRTRITLDRTSGEFEYHFVEAQEKGKAINDVRN